MNPYQIFTDATADMDPELIKDPDLLQVIPMDIEIGGKTYSYGPNGNITAKEFYEIQRAGNFGTTSQVNPYTYFDAFEACLKKGIDVLYLCFSSGLSGTIVSAQLCVNELSEKYPERTIICIDTLAASIGEGFLVYEAVKKKQQGYSLDELVDWVKKYSLKVCHWFTVDTFEHLRHGGRVSAFAAAAGSALNIKPLLNVDEEGHLKVKEKPRGRKKAMISKLKKMQEGWTPGLGKGVFIGHGDNPEAAEELRKAVLDKFPDAEISIADIGPVIGCHTGPGMLALVYWGDNR